MTPLRSYHAYCHKYTIAPDVDAPAAVQEATVLYVAKGKAAATREQRELLRAHRSARQGVPDIFATVKPAGRRYAKWCTEHATTPKTSPPGQPRPWLTYARARLAEGYTCPEIAKALGVPVSRIKDLSQSLKEPK